MLSMCTSFQTIKILNIVTNRARERYMLSSGSMYTRQQNKVIQISLYPVIITKQGYLIIISFIFSQSLQRKQRNPKNFVFSKVFHDTVLIDFNKKMEYILLRVQMHAGKLSVKPDKILGVSCNELASHFWWGGQYVVFISKSLN